MNVPFWLQGGAPASASGWWHHRWWWSRHLSHPGSETNKKALALESIFMTQELSEVSLKPKFFLLTILSMPLGPRLVLTASATAVKQGDNDQLNIHVQLTNLTQNKSFLILRLVLFYLVYIENVACFMIVKWTKNINNSEAKPKCWN